MSLSDGNCNSSLYPNSVQLDLIEACQKANYSTFCWPQSRDRFCVDSSSETPVNWARGTIRNGALVAITYENNTDNIYFESNSGMSYWRFTSTMYERAQPISGGEENERLLKMKMISRLFDGDSEEIPDSDLTHNGPIVILVLGTESTTRPVSTTSSRWTIPIPTGRRISDIYGSDDSDDSDEEQDEEDDGSKLSKQKISGIVAGVFIGTILLILLCCRQCCNGNKRKTQRQPAIGSEEDNRPTEEQQHVQVWVPPRAHIRGGYWGYYMPGADGSNAANSEAGPSTEAARERVAMTNENEVERERLRAAELQRDPEADTVNTVPVHRENLQEPSGRDVEDADELPPYTAEPPPKYTP